MVTLEMPAATELRDVYNRTGSAIAAVKVIANAGPMRSIECLKVMRTTFNLGLADVKPICGWWPAGTGELSDSRIDELLVPAIEAARPTWDTN